MKFAEQLKTARESLGLNQAEAAALLECGKRTLEHWEAGTRTPLAITQEGALNRIRRSRRRTSKRRYGGSCAPPRNRRHPAVV